MSKFFSFIIRQSVAIVLAVIFVLAFGVYSTGSMAINLLPDINVPMVCIQIIYPGANAQSVEADVTAKVEEGLSSIGGVTAVDSYSYDNLSAVVLSFEYGTDTSQKKNDINGKLFSLDLPDGITTDVYDIDLNAEALAVLSVTSDSAEAGLESAYEAAKELADRISNLDGVENVEIKGGADEYFAVKPFIGLELIAPLLVQAFSYGALDIPIGNLMQDNREVQIRNNSDIKSFEDILNTPISLPSTFAAMLSSVKQIMKLYEDSKAEDLEQLKDDLQGGVAQVLSELDTMTYEQVNSLARLKTYMNISDMRANDLDEIKNGRFKRYYDEIEKQVEGKDDDELQDLTDDIVEAYPLLSTVITVDLLKVVRDGNMQKLIDFRAQKENGDSAYEMTDEDYLDLASTFELYPEETTDKELLENIDFVKRTSASGLTNIANKKRNEGDNYSPTDGECVLLFAGTPLASDHPVIMSATFMAFVRADSYEQNMQTLIESRSRLGGEISASEYYDLYNSLDLTGVIELTLSEELINFILVTDLTDLTPNADGGQSLVVKVSDVATVTIAADYSSYVYFGRGSAQIVEGTTIEIYKSNGANASAVVEAVKQVCKEYTEESGAKALGAKVALLDDQSQFISDSISNVLVSMIIGGVLAILVIFVFLKKLRTSLIIAVTMPLSVLASLICLYLMGITLNMVSLGGLAVGIGMLVDNSIVVIEAISKHRDLGKSAFQAAVDGTTEVGGALFGSTLTTVCVFIPILFSGGLTGEIFTDLSFAVIFSLALSLIVAVTVIPALYSMTSGEKRMLSGGNLSQEIPSERKEVEPEIVEKHEKVKVLAAIRQPKLMNGITNFYGRLLPKVLNRKVIPILSAIIIFGASIGLLFLTGSEFLPSIDKGQIEVNMTYGSTERLENIERDVFDFAEVIRNNVNNIDYISASIGKNGMLALTDTGIITLQLTTNRGTDGVVEQIRTLATENAGISTRNVTVRQIDGVVASLMSGADDLSVTVLGNDSQTLKEIASKIGGRLEEEGFRDIKNSATDKSIQYDIVFDKTELSRKGLDYQTVVLTLRIGIASYTACTATIEGEECKIAVSFADGAVSDISSLENFVLGYGTDSAIRLKDVAVVTRSEVEACIRRSDGRQMISISATLPGTDTGTAGNLMQEIARGVLEEYDDYSFQQSGIASYLNDAFGGLAVALVISFFLLFAVMAVQFGSAVKSLIIMASIPFSFTGGFIALVITGTSLNVVSFIGLIMLMGVVVNNAIVMLEKIKQLHNSGMPHYLAVQEACKVRLRPIFMTTLTTILALIPLAIGVGQGSELMQPLGIVVIGGLLIGTLVTLVLIPAVYSAVHRLSEKFPEGKKKAKKAI